jgi:hypothetical protein
MKPYLDLLRLWLREYFKHPVENIRQAYPIVPGRLYRNFGNICKVTPYTKAQQMMIDEQKKLRAVVAGASFGEKSELSGISPDGALEMLRSSKGSKQLVWDLGYLIANDIIDVKCAYCDFHNKGIPCPLRNALADGKCVCDNYRYVIIKPAPHVY